jgi:uncharacterized protein (TIGR03435 family)
MRTASIVLGGLCSLAWSSSAALAQWTGAGTAPPGYTEPSQPAPKPMDPNASPSFEVATIKPSDPDKCCARTFARNGRHFATANTNLQYLMQYAFDLQARQIAGGPPWFNDDRFNVVGEIAGEGTPNARQWKEALQTLLVERFKIKMHHEMREMPVYALVIAKDGPKLTKGDGDPAHPQSMGFSGAYGQTMEGGGANATLADLAGELQRLTLDRPVLDRTGLTGTFNIHLIFTRENPDAMGLSPDLPDDAAPSIFVAIQQQLGLKLEPTKGPVDVLVVDHAEKPSED